MAGLSGLAQLGLVAGGAAEGIRQGSEMRRRDQEEKRRQEQYAYEQEGRVRERAINESAGRRLGMVGQDPGGPVEGYGGAGDVAQPPTGRKYTEAEAYRDMAGDVGRLGGDPMKAAQLRTTGMKIEQQSRKNDQQDLVNRAMDIARKTRLGMLPEHEAIRQLAELHGPIPDGRQASVTDIGGKPHAVLTDERTRTSSVHPITGDGSTFAHAFQEFLSLVSPESYTKERELGLKKQAADAATTTAGAHATEAATHASEAPARMAYYRGMAAYGRGSGSEHIVNLVNDKGEASPYAFNSRTRGFDPLPLPAGMRFANQKSPIQAMPGNPGMFTDGERMFRMDEKTQQLVEVATPQSLDKVARTIKGNLPGQQQGGQGLKVAPQTQFPYRPSGEGILGPNWLRSGMTDPNADIGMP